MLFYMSRALVISNQYNQFPNARLYVWMMDSEIKKINPKINTYDKYVSYILQEN